MKEILNIQMSADLIKEHPEILLNQVIKKNYKLSKVLGKGTFSVVYQCVNLENKEKLAIKIGFPGQGQKMMNLEKKIYRMLSQVYGNHQNGDSGFSRYYQFGKTEKFSFIVLQRLSASIEDIFVKLDHKFSIKTVLNIGLQGIELIEKFHEIGYIHRDIKPSNFLLGHGKKKDKLYLVDFGLARKITNEIRKQSTKQFVGTKRFASIASHLGVEQSKKDDLQSLGYTLIFLLKGRLPWQGIKLASKFQKYETIGKIKQDIDLQQFCKLEIKDQILYNGQVFLKLFRYLRVLNYGDNPNYEFLRKLFLQQISNIEKKPSSNGFNRWKCNDKFDWMDEADIEYPEKNKAERKRNQQKSGRQSRSKGSKDREKSQKYQRMSKYMEEDLENQLDEFHSVDERRKNPGSRSNQKSRYMK